MGIFQRLGTGVLFPRLRQVGTVAYNVLDGLVGPERTTVTENGTTQVTQGFFRSRTNVSALVTGIVGLLHVTGVTFGLGETELVNLVYYGAEVIGLILVAIFRHKADTSTRIITSGN